MDGVWVSGALDLVQLVHLRIATDESPLIIKIAPQIRECIAYAEARPVVRESMDHGSGNRCMQ